MMHYRVLSHARSVGLAGLLAVAVASAANAQKKYDPGATDTEIKIGNIMPYSGPASAYATIGKTEAAYFNKINAEGGINGRKINFISYDDGYSPPKTVEQARKLVEADEVLLIFNPLGTPSNSAIQKYMNAKKVPQLFVSTGAAKWNDPKNFPWTIGWQPSYQVEARIYAAYILKNYPGKTIGVLYQNDDFGKDYVIGLREGLGDQANKLIVVESSYETTSPTVDSQVVQIKGANPDIFVNVSTPKFAAQAYQDQPDRLRAARTAADDALQGRELGSVRADHVRRKEQLSRRNPSPLWGGLARSAGVGVAHGVRKKSLRKRPPTRPAFGRPPSPRGGGIRKQSLTSRHPSTPTPHPWPAVRRFSSSDPRALSSAPPAGRPRSFARRRRWLSNPRSAGSRHRVSADGRRRVL